MRWMICISSLILAVPVTADELIETSTKWRPSAQQESNSDKAARLKHLEQAIQHLRDAGLTDLAAEIEEHAEREVLRSELAIKRAEIERIQNDITRLERLLGEERTSDSAALPKKRGSVAPLQVATRIKLLEIDLAKLQESGFKVGGGGLSGILLNELPESKTGGGPWLQRQKIADPTMLKLIDWLREMKCAKVLAEPTLVTTHGRPASFFSGGEMPVITKEGDSQKISYKQIGTRVDLVTRALPNGKIQLEIRPTLSRVVQAAGTADAKEPQFEIRTLNATVELSPGQTLVLGGIAKSTPAARSPLGVLKKKYLKQPSGGKRELIMLITPEPVDLTDLTHSTTPVKPIKPSPPRSFQPFPHGK